MAFSISTWKLSARASQLFALDFHIDPHTYFLEAYAYWSHTPVITPCIYHDHVLGDTVHDLDLH